ncbi:MAG: putative quinol monooxygenase [Ilumatobacteraceae bacterium]
MSIVVLVEFPVRPGAVGEFAAALAELLPDTRAREGFESLRGYVDSDDPGTYVVIERWRQRADHEGYMRWRVEVGGVGHMADLMTGAPRIRYLENDPVVDP